MKSIPMTMKKLLKKLGCIIILSGLLYISKVLYIKLYMYYVSKVILNYLVNFITYQFYTYHLLDCLYVVLVLLDFV